MGGIETMTNKFELYRILKVALKAMEQYDGFYSEVMKIEKRLHEIGVSYTEIENFELYGYKAL